MKVLNGIGTRMNQIVNLNVLLGIIGIPINIMIAASLANAVSAAAIVAWNLGMLDSISLEKFYRATNPKCLYKRLLWKKLERRIFQ